MPDPFFSPTATTAAEIPHPPTATTPLPLPPTLSHPNRQTYHNDIARSAQERLAAAALAIIPEASDTPAPPILPPLLHLHETTTRMIQRLFRRTQPNELRRPLLYTGGICASVAIDYLNHAFSPVHIPPSVPFYGRTFTNVEVDPNPPDYKPFVLSPRQFTEEELEKYTKAKAVKLELAKEDVSEDKARGVDHDGGTFVAAGTGGIGEIGKMRFGGSGAQMDPIVLDSSSDEEDEKEDERVQLVGRSSPGKQPKTGPKGTGSDTLASRSSAVPSSTTTLPKLAAAPPSRTRPPPSNLNTNTTNTTPSTTIMPTPPKTPSYRSGHPANLMPPPTWKPNKPTNATSPNPATTALTPPQTPTSSKPSLLGARGFAPAGHGTSNYTPTKARNPKSTFGDFPLSLGNPAKNDGGAQKGGPAFATPSKQQVSDWFSQAGGARAEDSDSDVDMLMTPIERPEQPKPYFTSPFDTPKTTPMARNSRSYTSRGHYPELIDSDDDDVEMVDNDSIAYKMQQFEAMKARKVQPQQQLRRLAPAPAMNTIKEVHPEDDAVLPPRKFGFPDRKHDEQARPYSPVMYEQQARPAMRSEDELHQEKKRIKLSDMEPARSDFGQQQQMQMQMSPGASGLEQQATTTTESTIPKHPDFGKAPKMLPGVHYKVRVCRACGGTVTGKAWCDGPGAWFHMDCRP